jgi:hypothetical protein
MCRTLPAATLVMALAVAGCSSSTSGGGTTPAPWSTTVVISGGGSGGASGGGAGGGGGSSSAASGSGGGTLTQQQAQDALLSAADLGSTFSEQPSDDSPSPLPCRPNDPPIDEQIPPQVKALASFANSAGTALLEEEIDGYKDVATTQHVLSLGEDGLSCKSATIAAGNRTIKVKLNGPVDLTSQLKVKADKVDGWQVAGGGEQLVLIAAQLGTQLVIMTFTAAKNLDTSSLPNTQAIVEKALEKVEAQR